MTEARAIADVVGGTQAAADGYVRIEVGSEAWRSLKEGCVAGFHDLSAMWYDAGQVRMALMDWARGVRAIVSIATRDGAYPSVGRIHPPALRLERAMRDLYGTKPDGIPDERSWLDHGAWPTPPPGLAARPQAKNAYGFLPVEGDGLHQIPVGPVHAGIIEPGHFRFTANGEAVVRLEQRLGYQHKGVEALCAGADIERAAKIAGRMSGDSTVAYAFAFARAVEAALDWQVPARAHALRGIMAEIERISHHVNDVGAICNDASVVAIQARCTLIREEILRTAARCFGHRMMMDRVVPGGVVIDIDADGALAISKLLSRVETLFRPVVKIYDNTPSLLDRTVTTGTTKPEYIRRFAAGGFVGRAGGRAFDARASFPYPPYDALKLAVPTREASDVDARVWIRIEETWASIAIIRDLLRDLPTGTIRSAAPPMRRGEAAALVEAFRGDVFLTVRLDENGRVAHMHARDASWFQWPLLETAIEGNIVADFPLCNKSFNCSYSGHDL